MLVFIVLAGIGLVLLLLSFLLDGIFDFDMGDGLLSGTSLAVFLAVFGFGGIIAMAGFHANAGIAALVGAALGVVAGLLAGLASKYLRNSTSGETSASQLVGEDGVVITPAAAGERGEITAKLGGIPTKLTAICDEPLALGDAIRVTQVLSSTSVRVAKK